MANLLLTTVCNRRCPYCFAQSAMGGGASAQYLSLPDLVRAADLLVASRVRRVGVLGGEPTLHPAFVDICRYLVDRRLRVTVFTNGLTSPATLAAIAAIPEDLPLTFVVNVNYPEVSPPAEQERQRRFLSTLGTRCEISLNLFRPELDPCFAVELGERCGTSRTIRLGLAQPVLGKDLGSEFLAAGFYREAAASTVALAEAAFAKGGSVHFDCGFALCAFTDVQLGALQRRGTRLRFACELAIDIAPNLDSWACFPLVGEEHARLSESSRIDEIHRRFKLQLDAARRERRAWGIFPECGACAYRAAGQCAGGCLAHALQRAETSGARPRAQLTP
jgi:radical SAM protein with 4Fe4S-binding SPASM domain